MASVAPVDEDHVREALLDRFPVREAELDQILALDLSRFNDRLPTLVSARLVPRFMDMVQTTYETVYLVGIDESNVSLYQQAQWVETAVTLLGRRSDRALLNAMFDCCKDETTATAKDLMTLVHDLVWAEYKIVCGAKLSSEDDAPATPSCWIQSLSSQTTDQVISRARWIEWATTTAPHVHLALSTVMHHVWFQDLNPWKPAPLRFPPQDEPSKLSFVTSAQLALMGLSGCWKRLYHSHEDGLAFLLLQNALQQYSGPTVLLIQTGQGELLGYYTDQPWKSSTSWSPVEGDSFLFSLHPQWKVYSKTGECEKYGQYLYTAINSRTKPSLEGLAIGGVAADAPRLYLTPSLEQCQATSFDTVFTSGPLLSEDSLYFEVDSLQVWALAPTDAALQQGLAQGELHASVKEAHRRSLASVDKRQFVDDFESGAFLNHLYQHRTQTRGRHSFNASDDEDGSYYIEGKKPSNRPLSPEKQREEESSQQGQDGHE